MATVVRKVGFKQETYYREINNVLNSFRTNNSKFMLPTVLSSYRRGINPVKANYQYLQEALLTKDCEFKLWFIMYVNETKMVEDMIEALHHDIKNLKYFIDKYKCMGIHDDSTLILQKHYSDFVKIKVGFEEYNNSHI